MTPSDFSTETPHEPETEPQFTNDNTEPHEDHHHEHEHTNTQTTEKENVMKDNLKHVASFVLAIIFTLFLTTTNKAFTTSKSTLTDNSQSQVSSISFTLSTRFSPATPFINDPSSTQSAFFDDSTFTISPFFDNGSTSRTSRTFFVLETDSTVTTAGGVTPFIPNTFNSGTGTSPSFTEYGLKPDATFVNPETPNFF